MSGGDRLPTRAVLPAALLAVAVAAVFGRMLWNQPVGLDDPLQLGGEAVRGGLTLEGARWSLAAFAGGLWHPVTWLSHMAAVSLFGTAPWGHQLVNLLLHAAGAAALFLALRALTGSVWRSALAAGLWALHPLRVESVAWLAERKDLLCGLFLFLGLWAYALYARRGGVGRYLLVAGCFLLALGSKAAAVVFPPLLLLLDGWPLGRFLPGDRWRRVREKLPLAVLALPVAALAYAAERSAGAIRPEGYGAELWGRAGHAVTAVWSYLGLTLGPVRLSVYYPYPDHPPAWGWTALGAAALAAVTWGAWRWRGRFPALLTGWLWFLLALAPVMGVVPLGGHLMADRFTYLPQVGLAVAAVWGGQALLARRPRLSRAATVAALLALAALAAVSFARTGDWRDEETLYRRSLLRDGHNWLVARYLGVTLVEKGRLEEAVPYLRTAVLDRPRDPRLRRELASAYLALGAGKGEEGRLAEALAALSAAEEMDSGLPGLQYNLGVALAHLGREGEAAAHLGRALAQDPADEEAARLLKEVDPR